jgi:hypothetical protein
MLIGCGPCPFPLGASGNATGVELTLVVVVRLVTHTVVVPELLACFASPL